jgi:hypothetical protein
MDADEIRRKLEEHGIPTGEWTSTPGGRRPAPATVLRQVDMLRKLVALLEGQVAKDREAAADLHEKLARLKHGGGR